jgi:hypothetical protein
VQANLPSGFTPRGGDNRFCGIGLILYDGTADAIVLEPLM